MRLARFGWAAVLGWLAYETAMAVLLWPALSKAYGALFAAIGGLLHG